MQESEKEWWGSPLDMAEDTMEYSGVREIAIEFDNGDRDIFKPLQRDNFEAYELHQMATYLDSIAHSVRNVQRD